MFNEEDMAQISDKVYVDNIITEHCVYIKGIMEIDVDTGDVLESHSVMSG
jgi:hypothetical protein